jgi:hypothetical protein
LTDTNPGETIQTEIWDRQMGHADDDTGVRHWNPRGLILDHGLVFAAGLGLAATIGSLFGILTHAAVLSAIGSAILTLGVLCLLSAGMTGGQYTALGVGRGAERYNFVRDSFSFGPRRDRPIGGNTKPLIEELHGGYRPKRDHIAFWLGLGGILYVATGFVILGAGS